MNLVSLLLGIVTTTVSYTATPVQAAPLPISVTDVRQLDGETETTQTATTTLYGAPSESQTPSDATACSCTAYAHFLDPRVPYINASDFELNSNLAVGHIAVFYYPKSGLYHVAYITDVQADTFTVRESNFRRCQYTTRTLSKDDKALIGFYAP